MSFRSIDQVPTTLVYNGFQVFHTRDKDGCVTDILYCRHIAEDLAFTLEVADVHTDYQRDVEQAVDEFLAEQGE